MKCKDCKFFKMGNMHDGECRIRAATIPYPTNASVRNKGLWPVVDQSDWCVEFVDKKEFQDHVDKIKRDHELGAEMRGPNIYTGHIKIQKGQRE